MKVHRVHVSYGIVQKWKDFTCHDVTEAFPVLSSDPKEWDFHFTKFKQGTHCLPLLSPLQCWVRTYHFHNGRHSEGDVDTSGNAVVDDWTEGLSVKNCLEGSRIHPILVKAWTIDGESVASSCREQRPCERSATTGDWLVFLHKEKTGHGRSIWAPPTWARECGLGW